MSLTQEPSQELVEWLDRGNIPPNVVRFARMLDIEATLDQSAINPAVYDIMSRILDSEDADAVFAAAMAGTTAGKDFIDVPFLVKRDDWEWKKSAAMFREQGGFPFYTLMRVVNLQTGEQQVVSCGGYTHCTVMWRLAQLQEFDKESDGLPMVLKGKPAPAGIVIIPQRYIMPKVVRETRDTDKTGAKK